MQEQTLNGVIHLFAILASLEGRSGGESAKVVESYLTRLLSIQSPEVYLGLFADLFERYAEGNDPAALQRGLEALGTHLATRLSRDDKQFVLLQALQFHRLLSFAPARAEELLGRLAVFFEIPLRELEEARRFIAATSDSPASPQTQVFSRPGWRGRVVVFHSEWTGHFFLRILEGDFTLDENPLEPGRLYPLGPGAIVRDAGGHPAYLCELERLFSAPDAKAGLVFEAEDLAYDFPGGGHGLLPFRFRETGGRLVGVMGGSGAGKSTLINLLNGSLRPTAGRVAINGISLYDQPEKLQGVIGYVPQDDLLFEDLTVQQNLDYSARLCLAHLSPEQRGERVLRVLRELKQEETASLKVGDPLSKTISGGQRKRLNIALELIREPAILFVDEPTSGLSSADSEVVMGLLKAQAARGRLVIVSIHQPSSALFRLLDALWILDRGQAIYTGHPLEAARHFREHAHLAGADKSVCPECGNVNPEQIFSIIESRALDAEGRFSRERKFPPGFWHELWRTGKLPPAAEPPPVEPPPRHLTRPSWLGQCRTFFSRTLAARFSSRAYLLINVLEPPLLGGITAWLCRSSPGEAYLFGDNPYVHVYFFMAVIVAVFLGLSVSAEEIVRDRRVLQRERFLHLSWSAYAGAKMAFIALLALFQTALCAVLGIALLQIPGILLPLWAVLFSVAVFGGFLGLNISALFKSAVTVYILIPLLLIPQMLLGGLIIAYEDLRSRQAPDAFPPVIGEVMASRWAFEALAVEQFQRNACQQYFYETEQALSRVDYLRNDLLPALAGRLDYYYLDTATPQQRESTRRLLLHELATLEQTRSLTSGLARAAAELSPPDRAGLGELKAVLREEGKGLQRERQELQTRRQEIHKMLLEQQGEEGLAQWTKRHTNRKIVELVRNKSQLESLRIQGERLVQLSDPIYQEPASAWGRAPFLAGAKRLGSVTFRTFPFNLGVIWLMNATLAVFLMIPKRMRKKALNPS